LKREPPFDIPAGTSEDIECILETRQPGPFESQIHLYLDDLGLREIIMTVKGEVKPGDAR
jgi:hypothetical protein